jgi:hypothetical protein
VGGLPLGGVRGSSAACPCSRSDPRRSLGTPSRGTAACRLAEASIRTRGVPRSRSGASDASAGAAARDHLPRFIKESSAEPRFSIVDGNETQESEVRSPGNVAQLQTDRRPLIRVSAVPPRYGPLPLPPVLVGVSARSMAWRCAARSGETALRMRRTSAEAPRKGD